MDASGLVRGLVAGCVAVLLVAVAGFWVLRTAWPEYAAAEPSKSFTLSMLVVRLTLGALGTAVAAVVATLSSDYDRRAAWWLGGLFLCGSLPVHLYSVWADYPLWYHVVYLGYLVPIAVLTGRGVRDKRTCTWFEALNGRGYG